MNYFNNINLNQNELQKAVMHPLAQAPLDPKQGQMYFNTGNKKLYYYDNTKWVALNDIDLSNYVTTTQLNDELNNKLDKQTTTHPTIAQVYAVRGDTQQMINATSEAKENTVVLRDANGGLQVAEGVNDANAVNKGQMDKAIAKAIEAGISGLERTDNKVTAITGEGSEVQYPSTGAVIEYVKGQVSKVKDVTLDGISIVDTETGVVALESTYSTTLTGTSGTLTQEQYDNLSGDDASYIWYTQTGVQPIRLTKVMSGEGSLLYQAVASDIVMAVGIQSDKTWGFAQFNVEDAANKKTAIAGSGNDTDYPTTKAVADYVGNNTAPKDHATTATTYGVGTTQKYGHVKLVAGDMNGKANEDGQVPSLNHTHSQYALLSGATFTGAVTIGGNLTVNGTTTTIKSTTLAVKDKLIEVASDNTVKLTTPAGLVVPKYDGTKNGALVFDGDGIAYVGDVTLNANGDIDVANSDLVALAGRAKTIADGNLVKWDATNQIFVDTEIAASNLATTDTAQTISGVKTFTGNVILSSTLQAGTSVGTSGQVLTSQGDGGAPIWKAIPAPSNMVTTNTSQTITASKIFEGGVAFDAQIILGGSSGTAGQVLTSQGANKAPQWTTIVKKFVNDFTGNNTDLEFSFEHALGTNQCTVSLYKLNDSSNYEMVMADIILTTTNVIIKFAQAPTTTDSFRVVVTG